MTEADVIEILGWLADAGVAVWLDGGWGVDALIGEQTREHKDLDLIVRDDRVACLSAEAQMSNHAWGYTPGDTDFRDMRLLHERLGTVLLPPYDQEG